MSATSVLVGIGIAKGYVDVSELGARFDAQRFDNAADTHSAMALAFTPLDVALLVMNATGRGEAAQTCAQQAASLPVTVINPRQARDVTIPM